MFKIKLCRNSASEKSGLNELKMDLFDYGKPDEFLLFVQIFNITIEASGTLESNPKLQYLSNVLHVEAPRYFDALCI